MLKTFFKSELSMVGNTTCLTHGPTSELYEKPTVAELGNILDFTEGLFNDSADMEPYCGNTIDDNNSDDDNNDG